MIFWKKYFRYIENFTMFAIKNTFCCEKNDFTCKFFRREIFDTK